jgi:thymidylate synthase (FAD)
LNVKLISYSQPTEELKSLGIDDAQELIAFCARVSNPSNQLNTETSDKLIRYLINHKHWSPLEMVSACVEVETTRDIARQILRHRSFSFQEFSQRYADPTSDLSFEIREARYQDAKNRQNSLELDMTDEHDVELSKLWVIKQQDVIRLAKETYEWAVNNNIAKEVARAVLPEGNTVSRLYINGTLRSYIHFIDVRSDESTQLEHRIVAMACAKAIADIFPMVSDFVH